MSAPTINEAECIACGNCVDECPSDVLALEENRAVSSNAEACIECGICVEACPVNAVSL